jgi:hypothetical protein
MIFLKSSWCVTLYLSPCTFHENHCWYFWRARKCLNSIRYQFQAITCRKQVRNSRYWISLHLADGLEYIRTGLSTGMKIDEFAPRLSFSGLMEWTILWSAKCVPEEWSGLN